MTGFHMPSAGSGGRWSTCVDASTEPALPRTKVVLHPTNSDLSSRRRWADGGLVGTAMCTDAEWAELKAIQERANQVVADMAAAREHHQVVVCGVPASVRILALADELDGADADSAFVAEVMREAVADTAPAGAVGWLARIGRRWFR